MQPHRISAGALVEQDGRILMVRAVKQGAYDFWVAPGGGVQGEESLVDAAKREVMEESGIEVDHLRLAYIEELITPDMRVCKFWFAAKAVGGAIDASAPEAAQEHITEAAWLSRDQMQDKTVFPSVLQGRFWDDLHGGFHQVVPLGLRRMELW